MRWLLLSAWVLFPMVGEPASVLPSPSGQSRVLSQHRRSSVNADWRELWLILVLNGVHLGISLSFRLHSLLWPWASYFISASLHLLICTSTAGNNSVYITGALWGATELLSTKGLVWQNLHKHLKMVPATITTASFTLQFLLKQLHVVSYSLALQHSPVKHGRRYSFHFTSK